MITISDIIDAKNHLIDRYNSPEYFQEQREMGYSALSVHSDILVRMRALDKLTDELIRLNLERETPTSPVNATNSE